MLNNKSQLITIIIFLSAILKKDNKQKNNLKWSIQPKYLERRWFIEIFILNIKNICFCDDSN